MLKYIHPDLGAFGCELKIFEGDQTESCERDEIERRQLNEKRGEM